MMHVLVLASLHISNPFGSFVTWARQNAPAWVYSVLGIGWHVLALITAIAVVDMIAHIFRPTKGEP